MSEIKQINTGVAELLAVKVPEGAHSFDVEYNSALEWEQLYYKAKFMGMQNITRCRDLPPGKWTPLGIDTELTEEQCRDVMPLYKGDYMTYINNEVDAHDTAKEAFASLMQANGCYSENPYKGSINLMTNIGSYAYAKLKGKWQQAEANTGTWLILKRLS